MSLNRKFTNCNADSDCGKGCSCQKPERSPQERIANILSTQNPLHDLMVKEKAPADNARQ